MDLHDVRKGDVIMFGDDVERIIYPLTIKALRKFVKIVEKMSETEDINKMSDADIDLMTDAAAIIMEKVDPELARDKERLEDTIDLKIFNRMMAISMGSSSPEA